MRGVSLGLWAGTDDAAVTAAMPELAELGATHVALVASWAQRDVRAVAIRPTEAATVDDAVLRRAIRSAHDHGLQPIVFPILQLEKLGPGQWRGALDPRDVDAWWEQYERFILHYAAIAAQERAVALVVGSELATTEAWRDRWYHLIARVEDAYDGVLVYSANWDHYERVSFWRRVDVVGVSAYFQLADDADASEAEMTRAWRARRDELLAFAAARDRPLWITEVGYPSRDGAAIRPWDYTRGGEVDLEEQRRAYAAFVAAWSEVDGLQGVLWWIWERPGGRGDGGYSPRGKPAAAVVRGWFAR